MTRTEHLNTIVAKCRANLSLADAAAEGPWIAGGTSGVVGTPIVNGKGHCIASAHSAKSALFIAACAGSAEVGWETTVGEINAILPHLTDDLLSHLFTPSRPLSEFCNARADAIIAAWPVELLGETR